MTVIVKGLRDALIEVGASSEKADAAEAVVAVGHVATKADIAELRAEIANLKAELYRGMWVQAGVIVGAVVALLKLLP